VTLGCIVERIQRSGFSHVQRRDAASDTGRASLIDNRHAFTYNKAG